MKTDEIDWLKASLDEIMLRSASPPWTKDEWAFRPVDLRALPDITVPQNTGSQATRGRSSLEALVSSSNASFMTSAVRGNVHCTTFPTLNITFLQNVEKYHDNFKANDTTQQVSDDVYERLVMTHALSNITGYHLVKSFSAGSMSNIPIFSAPRQLACCANNSTHESSVVIAYWSSNSSYVDERQPQPKSPSEQRWNRNFTMKWIVGQAKETSISGNYGGYLRLSSSGYRSDGNATLLIFSKPPDVQVLNCYPTIEYSNALVSVDKDSGQVLDYTIIGSPQEVSGPWEYPYIIGPPGSMDGRRTYNDTDGKVR